MNKAIICLASIAVAAVGCSANKVKQSTLEIMDREVLNATYVVCGTSVDWDGVKFSLEGLKTGAESVSKDFTIGKLTYEPSEIRKVDSLALAIDRMFQQMCSSTVALRNNPEALARYVVARDETALKLFAAMAEMQEINRKDLPAGEAVEKQEAVLKEVLPVVGK